MNDLFKHLIECQTHDYTNSKLTVTPLSSLIEGENDFNEIAKESRRTGS